MATIINNPGGGDRGPTATTDSGMGTGIIVGIFIAIVLGIVFWFFWPGVRSGGTVNTQQPASSTPPQSSGTPPVNLPSNINVNVNPGSSSGTPSSTNR